ncbi:uncharacterized protein APUU_12304S [Aspergillus puulaauensis]|uniref:MYND-type domain-containing protein n=1 Tax=Aspergillus puulaauensis TaxID=1220207 RepID=A0A7R7XE22_9EURO|nr:uncharacterized protein APUU_12304S [Aspergillus puulaauensis]BCS19476.1 hypothetical protein APUU_12304S [Aspergillus puulaauensis]
MDGARTRPTLQNEEDIAHVVWAAHIISYLTNKGNNAELADEADDDTDNDEITDHETDCETEKAVILSGSRESVRRKFLDCIAQLFSHCKGRGGVTGAALREMEDGVEVDIARNDGFSSDLEALGYCRIVEQYLAGSFEETKSPADSGTDFEQTAVGYMSERVDEWIKDLQRVIRKTKKARLCIDQQHGEETAAQDWARTMEQALQFDAEKTDSETRFSIVKHAYRCVNITEVQDLLSHMFGQDGQKLWDRLNFIARPLTDARLLRSIAVQEPQFRNCRVSLVPPKPKTALDERYVVGISEASERLGLGSVPASRLYSSNQSFKEACAEPFGLHAEMQLVLHYDEQRVPQPTLDYFGCSKKSCLLCETFLAALPNPIDTRGRHGVCYPAWGVPVSDSAGIQDTIKELGKSLVARIRELLNVKHLGDNVKQSEIVSGFSALTLEEWRQKELTVRQYKDSQTQQQRDMQIKQGIAPTTRSKHQPLQNFEPEDCCVMCNTSPGRPCARCRSTYYCSEECEKSDAASHGRLCEQFASQTDRPSPQHKRAIFFPADSEEPSLVWVPCTRKYETEERMSWTQLNPHPYLGTDEPAKESLRIEHNPVRSRNLGSGFAGAAIRKEGYCVSLVYRELYLKDGSKTNRSIQACIAASGPLTTPHEYRGPMIALRETHPEDYEDITLADFRHIMDYLVSYRDTKVRETVPDLRHRAPSTMRGVRICCYGELKVHGSHPFVAVDVTRSNQIALGDGSISPISVCLGMPLRLWKEPDHEFHEDPPGWAGHMNADSNQNVAFLMLETDPFHEWWGWAPMYWNRRIGNVCAVREDGEDLSMDDVAMMCYFVRRKLQPMFEEVLESDTSVESRRGALDFVTRDNMVAYWSAEGGIRKWD